MGFQLGRGSLGRVRRHAVRPFIDPNPPNMLNFPMPSREIRSCFVTGGTGFVGSHLVDQLLRVGCEVRCLVRDPKRPGWLEGKPVALMVGDLEAEEVLREGASGVDAVFHVAGLTAARTAKEYFRVNAEGSFNVARASLEAESPDPPR